MCGFFILVFRILLYYKYYLFGGLYIMKQKFIEFDKMSKKKQKEINNSHRNRVMFNTGTRVMATPKNPTRAQRKAAERRAMDW